MAKLKHSYDKGINGENVPDNTGRVARVAHWLGKRNLAASEERDLARERFQLAQFREAQSVSKGLNLTALRLVEKASSIPHQKREPKLPIQRVDPHTGVNSICWNIDLVHGAAEGVTPKIFEFNHVIEPLPDIDILQTTVNMLFKVPVTRVTVNPIAELTADGRIASMSTVIEANPRVYSPDDAAIYGETDADSVRITIGSEGTITDISIIDMLGEEGYKSQSAAELDAGMFLEKVDAVLDSTLRAYGVQGEAI